MAETRLDPAGLGRLHDVLEGHVERPEVPGIVALVAAGDDVHVDTIGARALDDRRLLGCWALFRIASLTKPMTAAAVLLLVDDGVLRLDDPVDELLPELASRVLLTQRSFVSPEPPEVVADFWTGAHHCSTGEGAARTRGRVVLGRVRATE